LNDAALTHLKVGVNEKKNSSERISDRLLKVGVK
jgi:hypothetical protein